MLCFQWHRCLWVTPDPVRNPPKLFDSLIWISADSYFGLSLGPCLGWTFTPVSQEKWHNTSSFLFILYLKQSLTHTISQAGLRLLAIHLCLLLKCWDYVHDISHPVGLFFDKVSSGCPCSSWKKGWYSGKWPVWTLLLTNMGHQPLTFKFNWSFDRLSHERRGQVLRKLSGTQ